MKANYNEVLEKEMDELLKPLYEYGYDGDGQFTYLLDELKNKFNETNYPGYLYRIADLYDGCYLEPNKVDDYKDYLEKAAGMDYVPAINRLNERCLEDINFEMMFNGHMFERAIDFDDPYGKYLLAKYYMMESIYDNTMQGFFIVGLKLMKESADQGCEKAIKFMRNAQNSEVLKYIKKPEITILK